MASLQRSPPQAISRMRRRSSQRPGCEARTASSSHEGSRTGSAVIRLPRPFLVLTRRTSRAGLVASRPARTSHASAALTMARALAARRWETPSSRRRRNQVSIARLSSWFAGTPPRSAYVAVDDVLQDVVVVADGVDGDRVVGVGAPGFDVVLDDVANPTHRSAGRGLGLARRAAGVEVGDGLVQRLAAFAFGRVRAVDVATVGIEAAGQAPTPPAGARRVLTHGPFEADDDDPSVDSLLRGSVIPSGPHLGPRGAATFCGRAYSRLWTTSGGGGSRGPR